MLIVFQLTDGLLAWAAGRDIARGGQRRGEEPLKSTIRPGHWGKESRGLETSKFETIDDNSDGDNAVSEQRVLTLLIRGLTVS